MAPAQILPVASMARGADYVGGHADPSPGSAIVFENQAFPAEVHDTNSVLVYAINLRTGAVFLGREIAHDGQPELGLRRLGRGEVWLRERQQREQKPAEGPCRFSSAP